MMLASMLVCLCWVQEPAVTQSAARLTVEPHHRWLPPFGLNRVEALPDAVIESPGTTKPTARFSIEQYKAGKSLGAEAVVFPEKPPFFARRKLNADCTEVALFETDAAGANREIARAKVKIPDIAIEAVVDSRPGVNPVDLGTILVPDGTLLLGPGQRGRVRVALLSRRHDVPDVSIGLKFGSQEVSSGVRTSLRAGKRAEIELEVPEPTPGRLRDVLTVGVSVDPNSNDTWTRRFPVMIVTDPPKLPAFGATALKLRYDAAVSLRDPKTGAYNTMDYDTAWDASLEDVVVSLPNGSRFVFWRGSSYIPFWAGKENTALCTEWAEEITRRPGAIDCVEPLMDKELRYGRVEIVESTPARVHVRWRYQSTDLLYHTWGDFAVEDYYFYRDGYGTRVLTLTSDPEAVYELSEFIVITPQGKYPFDVLPEIMIRVLLDDGARHDLSFPVNRAQEASLRQQPGWPAVYRVKLHRDDPATAIYFSPRDRAMPPLIFEPFSDRGALVTPAYWGSHWPLARGNATGSAIDARVDKTPAHNSLMSWVKQHPTPLIERHAKMLDAHGRERTMRVQTGAWLIGMTDKADEEVLRVARSYAAPAKVSKEKGDALMFDAARRCWVMPQPLTGRVGLRIEPVAPCVNPAFEFGGDLDPFTLKSVSIGGKPLEQDRYAWDGKVLWIDATIETPTRIEIEE